MTPKVNSRFHKFLTDTGQMENKTEIVKTISEGRVTSSKDLNDIEVLKYLDEKALKKPKNQWTPKGGNECDKKRKKIIAIFKSVGLCIETTKAYCKNLRGYGKDFNDYDSKELSKIIAIVEREKIKLLTNFK